MLERLFNLTFEKNSSVIPFYYEVKETTAWIQSFSLVFRGVYQKEIQGFKIEELDQENEKMYDQWEKKYYEVRGKLNHHKGLYTEYWILDQFRYYVVKKQKFFKKITQNLPSDFEFCSYERVWTYHATPEYSHSNVRTGEFVHILEKL